jgi:hypothetical protein
VKLYVCWGLFKTPGAGHPCRNAFDALVAAGYQPRIVRSYGWGLLPVVLNRSRGRREVRAMTGKGWVPLLVADDGEVVQGSHDIRAWAAQHSS